MTNKIYAGPAGMFTSPLEVEGKAVDAFLPGTLLKRTASGLETSDIAATAFNSELLVAKEIEQSQGGTITTPVTIGDTAEGIKVRSGEMVYAFVAAGNNITAKGLGLASNGDGTLKLAAADDSEQVLFNAEQVINVTGSAQLVLVSAK